MMEETIIGKTDCVGLHGRGDFKSAIEGVAVELIRFQADDVPELLSWVQTEADMVQWAGAALRWPLTVEQFRDHLQAAEIDSPTLYPFGLYEHAMICGYCELSDYRPRAGSAMLARVIVRLDHRGRGRGGRMVRGALAFGFEQLGLHRIGLGVFDFNESAIRCYTRAGFVREGVLRDSACVDGTYWSCHIMSILRHEWQQNRGEHDPT